MKAKIVMFFTLLLKMHVIYAQEAESNKVDSIVIMAISLSEEALYDARFYEAKEIVQLSYFKNFKGFKARHELLLIIQTQRIEGFMNRLYHKKTNSDDNFKQLANLLPCVGGIQEKDVLASFYVAFSNAHRSINNSDSASIYEAKALKIYKEIEMFDKVAEIQAAQISRIHLQYLDKGKKKEILELIPKYKQEIKYSSLYSKYALSYNTRHLAQIHRRQTLDYEEAIRLFKKSLQLREEIGFKPFIPASYSSLGDVYAKMNEHNIAIEMYLKAIEIACEIGFVRYQSSPYLSIGDIYLSQGDNQKATEYYVKALKSASINNFDIVIDSAIEKISRTKN